MQNARRLRFFFFLPFLDGRVHLFCKHMSSQQANPGEAEHSEVTDTSADGGIGSAQAAGRKHRTQSTAMENVCETKQRWLYQDGTKQMRWLYCWGDWGLGSPNRQLQIVRWHFQSQRRRTWQSILEDGQNWSSKRNNMDSLFSSFPCEKAQMGCYMLVCRHLFRMFFKARIKFKLKDLTHFRTRCFPRKYFSSNDIDEKTNYNLVLTRF